jgi:hypothetical protein
MWQDKIRAIGERHAYVINKIADKARSSWVFSLILIGYMVWEFIEHIVLPIAAAWFGWQFFNGS